jgi:hypothetical protein
MSEDKKFYTSAENKTRECHISFPNLPPDQEGGEPIKGNSVTISLNQDLL